MLPWLKRHGRRLAAWVVALGFGIPLVLTLAYRFVAPPITPLMLIRMVQGEGLQRHWVSIESVSPMLMRAVVASEDARFCSHHGFDWHAIDHAIDSYEEGGRLLGASTISMQTAKNVFLWPGRNFLRKGLEAGLTVLIEAIWGKRRIMEVYLNVIEWGPGIYGAEAAANHYFHKPALRLTRREAAELAAVLPNPLHWSPIRPDARVEGRIRLIEARMVHAAVWPQKVCR